MSQNFYDVLDPLVELTQRPRCHSNFRLGGDRSGAETGVGDGWPNPSPRLRPPPRFADGPGRRRPWPALRRERTAVVRQGAARRELWLQTDGMTLTRSTMRAQPSAPGSSIKCSDSAIASGAPPRTATATPACLSIAMSFSPSPTARTSSLPDPFLSAVSEHARPLGDSRGVHDEAELTVVRLWVQNSA